MKFGRYTLNLHHAMAGEWSRGHRKQYFRLQRYLHMSVTGSKTKKCYDLPPVHPSYRWVVVAPSLENEG